MFVLVIARYGKSNCHLCVAFWNSLAKQIDYLQLADDLNVDAPSYKWKQLDISNAADKQLVTDYLLWDSDECEGTFEGFEMYEGRVWK